MTYLNRLTLFVSVFAVVAVVSVCVVAQRVDKQQRAIVTTWNECVASFNQENTDWLELQKSLQTNPPWRVVDAREPGKRGELIDKIIAEHKRRIALLETIKRENLR